MRQIIPCSCLLSCYLLWLTLTPELGYAQQDTTRVKPDTTNSVVQPTPPSKTEEPEMSFGEIELMEITIEAIIEKPRVSMLPRRQEPKMEEMDFIDRSFDKELKKGPDRPMMVDKQMKEPDKIEQLIGKIKKKKQQKEKSNDK